MTDRPWPPFVSPVSGRPVEERDGALATDDGERFPIVNGIPRFVGDGSYASLFGAQWNRFPKTQLDSFTGVPITRDRLRRCLGDALWNALAGKQVLECGCGAGRFTEILLERGARVTSVDLSSAVDANAANFPIGDQHRVVQADIMALPFAPAEFDVVICLGVIQHTPNSERTIAALAGHVRAGGSLVIDHYTFEIARVTSVRPFFRAVLRRQRPERARRTVEALVGFFYPLHSALRSTRVRWSLLCRVSPITTFLKTYPELSEDLQREWAMLDTHDSLTDWFKHLRTRDQIRRTLERLGFADVWCEYGGNGVEARATRAASA